MSLILRVDVDKPYGRATFRDKVFSKLREDYWLSATTALGYLRHLEKYLEFLSEQQIKSHIYFRKCTLPPKRWFIASILEEHSLGLHAENTRSYKSFKKELEDVQSHFSHNKISSFTKHGSGELKLGRNHYPPYEPEKYKKWGRKSGVTFLFGNKDIMDENSDSVVDDNFYPAMFWIDRICDKKECLLLEKVVTHAKKKNIVILIHPANFMADQKVEKNMRSLVSLAKQQHVNWITIH